MLSKIEKKELLQDAQNQKRRESFRKGLEENSLPSNSLDAYIQFLSSVQKIFSSAADAPKKTISQTFKL